MYVHCYDFFICQLPNCNLFTQHLLSYGRDTASDLWTPVLFFTSEIHTAAIVLYCSSQTTIIIHTIHLILCLQQASEIDNLVITLGQSSVIVLCRFHVGAGIPGVAPHYTPPPSTFNVLIGSSWFDKLGFFLRENLLLYTSHLPLGVPNGRVLHAYQGCFLAPLPGRSRHAARGVSTIQSLYFVCVLLLFTFLFAALISKHKKISC